MTEHFHASMDRKIFNLGLSVEATSAYILITSIIQDNIRPALEDISSRWTISDQALHQALEELIGRRVLQKRQGPDGQDLYYPNPSPLWA